MGDDDHELAVLGEMVSAMMSLSPEERIRALRYLMDRYGEDEL